MKSGICMKIIFLDIDGVLNCRNSKSSCFGIMGVDNIKVEVLKSIVDKSGAKIVLISSWRIGWKRVFKGEQGYMANYTFLIFRKPQKILSHRQRVYRQIFSTDTMVKKRRSEFTDFLSYTYWLDKTYPLKICGKSHYLSFVSLRYTQIRRLFCY